MPFNALLVNRSEDKKITSTLEVIDESQLPEGDVTVDIDFSTLNYKDGLAITGAAPVIRHYPMIPGIDFAGTVTESTHPNWKAGDKVILNGWGVGEVHWGGLAQKARVNGDWLIAQPDTLNSYQAMAIGTAGYTAMLCVMALQSNGVKPEDGEILVTGANGGVGVSQSLFYRLMVIKSLHLLAVLKNLLISLSLVRLLVWIERSFLSRASP